MRAYRVYFHLNPRVFKANYRLVYANEQEEAENLVRALMTQHQTELDVLGFELVGVYAESESFSEFCHNCNK